MTRTPTATIQTVRYEKRLTTSTTDGLGDYRRWWMRTSTGEWIHARQSISAHLDRVDELETALAEIRFESSDLDDAGTIADAALVGTDR